MIYTTGDRWKYCDSIKGRYYVWEIINETGIGILIESNNSFYTKGETSRDKIAISHCEFIGNFSKSDNFKNLIDLLLDNP